MLCVIQVALSIHEGNYLFSNKQISFFSLHEVDESVPTLEGFIDIPCIINEVIKLTEEAVFLKAPGKRLNFH